MTMRLAKMASVWGLVGSIACTSSAAGTEPAPREEKAAAEKPAPKVRAARVETAVVEKTSASLDLSLPAEVRGSKEAVLGAPQGGYVEKVHVQVGDEVKDGDPMFSIDTAVYRARLAKIKAQKKAAERDLARAEKLGNVIAVAEIDGIRDRVDDANAAYRIAQLELSRAVVRAPFSGAIASVGTEKGEVTSPGTPLARLVRLDPIEVSMAVADKDVVGLEEGMKVTVSSDAVPAPREGVIARINPAADLDTRAFEVEIEVPNADQSLLPGMIARVTLSQEVAQDRLLIPQSFLVTKRKENGVFVVEDGVARWRSLTLGALIRDQVIVEDGLSAGEEVVTVGQRALVDGDALIVSRKGRCCVEGRPVFD